ncbi:hypothetical protein [Alloscardovia sp. HMSC034E08]|uniref:hypothetical protein n=1 Tax=Alloscardovia sp. HMSC034E08 TaxID=1739413 RepID=UPI0008CC95AC|nr:hypothetical protein [Alloscardovia sp. HMSC034E08]OFQ96668.1 hypothetical protein HMPREF2909_00435 [Alloscardovia sp. HMSC034E08]
MPDYNPDRLYEQYAKCRDAVEQYASRDRYHQWVLQQLKDTTIPGYDVWKRNQILAEMRTRDRAWLNNGTNSSVTWNEPEEKIKNGVEHRDYDVYKILSENGFKDIATLKSLNGAKGSDIDAAMNSQIWEIKSPIGESQKLVENNFRTAKKQFKKYFQRPNQPVRVIFNNLNTGLSDDIVIGLIQRKMKERGINECLLVGKDKKLLRFKND